ncbi:phospholipase D-like domain-containing protein [Pseudomonas sp. AAC]|uniref:phospholipase D-like domain-containing protein n=1 Tax=Pseudomonas sp. AAC TaxID=1502784 RepID=UPI0015A5142D|nr:phospholipase D-like domain-containing protein [Pseudomonas sp. AAC]
MSAFDALAPHCEVSASLCEAAGQGSFNVPLDLHSICTRAGLPQARVADVERSLIAGQACGVFVQSTPLTWQVRDCAFAAQLAPLLLGARLYRTRVYRDADIVEVVLTKPPAPSQISLQLEKMLQGSWGFRDTRQLLPAIAESASSSFCVMTPFFDEVGAQVVLNLFERTSASDRCLILRTNKEGHPPAVLQFVREDLSRLGVKVLNFRLDRPDAPGNETFHAKVILADDAAAYVGSSNLNQWSFEYSLELGLYVRGKAAARIATLLCAIRAVSGVMA